jgi:hypothetical protein
MEPFLISWAQMKAFLQEPKHTRFMRYFDDGANVTVFGVESPLLVKSVIVKGSADETDFNTVKEGFSALSIKNESITQLEKDDKELRCIWAKAIADENGLMEFLIPVPGVPGSEGRWIAYADIEFSDRRPGDIVSAIEVVDVDGLLGEAGAVVGRYSENEMPESEFFGGGVAMTFMYGSTEVQPVGGYGYVPSGFYLRIRAKSVAGKNTTGMVSIDWAKPKA